MIPRVLHNFSAFVNGQGYQGRVTEVEPPEIEVKTEDFRAGGMDGTAEIDMGLNTMSAKMNFAEYIPAILDAAGKLDGNATRVQLRGDLQRDGEAAVPCVIDLHGCVKKSS